MDAKEMQQAAQGAVDQSKSFLNRQVDERTTQIGMRIHSAAYDLRNAGEQLRQTPGSPVAPYVDRGADLVERFGDYLQEADSDRIIGDLESFARSQPWALAAGAAALGFAASRFLKTSSTRRYRLAADARYRGGGGEYAI
jgi:hypothetical protein